MGSNEGAATHGSIHDDDSSMLPWQLQQRGRLVVCTSTCRTSDHDLVVCGDDDDDNDGGGGDEAGHGGVGEGGGVCQVAPGGSKGRNPQVAEKAGGHQQAESAVGGRGRSSAAIPNFVTGLDNLGYYVIQAPFLFAHCRCPT